jgi:hypothetical protein
MVCARKLFVGISVVTAGGKAHTHSDRYSEFPTSCRKNPETPQAPNRRSLLSKSNQREISSLPSWHDGCSRFFTAGQTFARRLTGMRVKQIHATLGELIAAVTDEVRPIAGNQANVDALVSYIVNDLLVAKRVKLRKRAALGAV